MTSTTAPELSDPRWELLKLQTMRELAEPLLGVTFEAETLREAFSEIITKLKAAGKVLDFACGRCNVPIDDVIPRCWACGAVIEESVLDEPDMEEEEIRRRASAVGVDPSGPVAEVERRIEAAEKSRAEKNKKRKDAGGIEAEGLNRRITEEMPDGWKQTKNRNYTGYWDPSGSRRIVVFNRGLGVYFAVEDGFLDGHPNLEYLDERERKRRHFGRNNYIYTGDVAKEVLQLCQLVLERYASRT